MKAIIVALFLLIIPSKLAPTPATITIAIEIPSHVYAPSPFIAREHKAIGCMALAMYGEARGSTIKDQIAVGYSMVNRTNHRSYPATVCRNTLRPWQIESFHRKPKLRQLAIQVQRQHLSLHQLQHVRTNMGHFIEIATQIYHKQIPDPTNGATHFFNPQLAQQLGYEPPNWSQVYTKTASIGGHDYYRM